MGKLHHARHASTIDVTLHCESKPVRIAFTHQTGGQLSFNETLRIATCSFNETGILNDSCSQRICSTFHAEQSTRGDTDLCLLACTHNTWYIT